MSFEETTKTPTVIDDKLNLAHQSYNRHDFEKTILYVGSVITIEPVNKQALALLKTLVDNSLIDASTLIIENENEEPLLGNYSVLTYTLGYTKQFDQALVHLTKLLLLTEETLYLYWLEDWMTNEDFFKLLSLDALRKALVKLMLLPNQAEFNYSIREIYEFYLSLMMKAEKEYKFDESLQYIMAVVARRCLQFQRSILIAAKSYGTKPSYFNTLALAYAYRELKDYDNTVKFFKEAINFKSDAIEVKLELADYVCQKANLNSDDYKKGIQLYKEVADSNPQHNWAYPSYLFYSYMLEFNPSVLKQLENFCLENPGNERGTKLLQKIKTIKKTHK